MNNVHPFKRKQTPELDEARLDQACDWLAKLDRELSDEEKLQLQKWLHESKENLSCFLKTAKMWDKMDSLARLAELFPQKSDKPTRNYSFTSIAASLILCTTLLLGGRYWFADVDNNAGKMLATQTSYSTQVGESNTINLPDNSSLMLNTNTFVQVKYTENARVIDLQRGEIHIEVAHDPDRPLSVIAGGQVIQAVGTAFNVEFIDSAVELIVTDGRVLVDKVEKVLEQEESKTPARISSEAISVNKGEKVELQQNTESHVVEVVAESDIEANLSWRSGRLVFRGEPLVASLNEISRYTDLQFELIDQQAMQKFKIAGMFKTGDVNGLLTVLDRNFNIGHEKLDSGVIRLKING